jgi:hypothetical protein
MPSCPLRHLARLCVKKCSRDNEDGAGSPLHGGPKRRFDLARTLDLQRYDVKLQNPSRRLGLLPVVLAVWPPKDGHA